MTGQAIKKPLLTEVVCSKASSSLTSALGRVQSQAKMKLMQDILMSSGMALHWCLQGFLTNQRSVSAVWFGEQVCGNREFPSFTEVYLGILSSFETEAPDVWKSKE